MLFQRRTPPDWKEKFRVAVWPRRSWGRSLKYLAKRVLRLTASPHAIAGGIAAGVFSSFTPYMGLHFLIAFAVAYIIAGNMIAAAAGTFIGNPISFPFIWAATYSTGNFLLYGDMGKDGPHETLFGLKHISFWDLGPSGLWQLAVGIWEPVLKPMTIGAIPIGITVACIAYLITRYAAIAFQKSRRRLLAAKARELKEKAMASIDQTHSNSAS
ncbi:MAG: DUF2062 domain-containing protein [Salaquimonas sp.]